MNNSEALCILFNNGTRPLTCPDISDDDWTLALSLAETALIARIPTKPVHMVSEYGYKYLACPECGVALASEPFNKWFGKSPKHCEDCGQALDWSEVNV